MAKNQIRDSDDDAGCFEQEGSMCIANQLMGLMEEIKSTLDKSNGMIASDLSLHGVDLTDKEISQYLNGSKTVSESRLQSLANAAKALGVDGENLRHILSRGSIFTSPEHADFRQACKQLEKQAHRSEKATLDKFESALQDLVSMGWHDAELLALTSEIARKYIPPAARTEGAMIDPSHLNNKF